MRGRLYKSKTYIPREGSTYQCGRIFYSNLAICHFVAYNAQDVEKEQCQCCSDQDCGTLIPPGPTSFEALSFSRGTSV